MRRLDGAALAVYHWQMRNHRTWSILAVFLTGNAVDAAVATAFAMAVTFPGAGNIGGGGFMVIRLASGKATTIDYRERAPLRSTPAMYLDGKGAIDRSLAAEGYLAPATGRSYGRPDGQPWSAGDTLRLPQLARTLEAIATGGPDAFYRGWIADSLAADMAAHGGIMTKADLAAYRAVERLPVRGSFLGHEIIPMGPPSSGGTSILTMLNILERFDIAHRSPMAAGTLHLMIEAQRRAFLDRAEYLGDVDFGPVPVARLVSKAHGAELARTIDTTKATSSVAFAAGRVPVQPSHESDQTTHFSVVDAAGKRGGKVLLVTGSPGGRTIINTVHQIILNVTAFGMDVRQAVDAPRFHSQWLPDMVWLEPGSLPDSTSAALKALDHQIRQGGRIDNGHSILIDPKTGTAFGANDHRSTDSEASQ